MNAKIARQLIGLSMVIPFNILFPFSGLDLLEAPLYLSELSSAIVFAFERHEPDANQYGTAHQSEYPKQPAHARAYPSVNSKFG
jgi:hypothetical protein